MPSRSSIAARRNAAGPNIVRRPLDDVDRRLLRELAADARIPNNALAERAGIAPSTCLGRVRALRESGVIRGFHADIDPAALDRPIQAMISVRLQSSARSHIAEFMAKIAQLPEVLNVFFLGGADDFHVHIAARSTDNLRDFVVINLSRDPDVALTETSLIFDHIRAGLAH
jgi:DNA-binding Lrp family transcriptional regulator